jgi:hypothetical protein
MQVKYAFVFLGTRTSGGLSSSSKIINGLGYGIILDLLKERRLLLYGAIYIHRLLNSSNTSFILNIQTRACTKGCMHATDIRTNINK